MKSRGGQGVVRRGIEMHVCDSLGSYKSCIISSNGSYSHNPITSQRFPEELSGEKCFGSSHLRVMAGSGYKLVWAPVNAFVGKELGPEKRNEVEEGSGQDRVEEERCGCIHSCDPNVLADFTYALQRYDIFFNKL